MGGRQVQLRISGQTYRVVTSASDDELHRLTLMVEEKLTQVAGPGRMVNPQALLLAALALAHDLEEERARHTDQVARTRIAFGRMLERVDAALGALEPGADAPDEDDR
ncbi:cell division protein ZapA [Polyangium mundeleinium]|uniref:Cell division protein ZapA n=1 Tax=Polyangium mundeleinium TaxID=2995306 RepID=A0ABT5F6P4_9BACT|nr:cell division protein ZapA [Polyangium mundeleinium]MDC0749780.1 cell division protein ZapA [Polyangium mundeleinium]